MPYQTLKQLHINSVDFILPLNLRHLANGGTNGQKISKERNADVWKKSCQKLSTLPHGNGAKLIEKKILLRDFFHSNGHSVEAAPLRDSCKTAETYLGPSP